ncbi:MAG: nitroreductase [Desulfurococcales archaeon ex4484_58]|nr:MAG: nitroreductase [Desulfurococcales archaeon ex4484_58]
MPSSKLLYRIFYSRKFKFILPALIIALILLSIYIYNVYLSPRESIGYVEGEIVYLPLPRIRKDVLSVEEALAYRRSIRDYRNESLTIEQLSQLLWAAYGITEPRRGFKTSPSAGATYPLEIYVVIKSGGVRTENNTYLQPGVYHYDPYKHVLVLVKKGDFSRELMRASLDQEWVGSAPINIVIAAVFERTTRYYGERGVRYVYMEVGHAGQNIYLEATALGLGCVVVGAFYDEDVKEIVGLKDDEEPMYIIPVGVPKKSYRVSEEEIHQYILRNRGG